MLTEFKASSPVAGVLSPVGLKTKQNTNSTCDIACTAVAFNFLCLQYFHTITLYSYSEIFIVNENREIFITCRKCKMALAVGGIF